MIVVSDTSPITNLVGVRRLEILRLLFGEVVIPATVRAELLAGPAEGAAILEAAAWIRVEVLRDRELATRLAAEVDAGEAEAIALAVQLRADVLLVDERRGRSAAKRHGVKPMGLVGVLLDAKRAEIIDAVRPILDELIESTGFYLDQALYEHAVKAAGEAV